MAANAIGAASVNLAVCLPEAPAPNMQAAAASSAAAGGPSAHSFITGPDDAQTLALAKNPLRLAAGFLFIDSVGMVLMNALTGAGDTKRVMYIAVSFQWLLFLPLVYLLGPIFGFGLVVIFAVQAAYRGLQAATFMSMWQRGRWQTIDLH